MLDLVLFAVCCRSMQLMGEATGCISQVYE